MKSSKILIQGSVTVEVDKNLHRGLSENNLKLQDLKFLLKTP